MAFNFGLANDYNVFVFGNMSMSNTDAEGRVAVGGNVTLSNYGVGAGITPLPPANTDPRTRPLWLMEISTSPVAQTPAATQSLTPTAR